MKEARRVFREEGVRAFWKGNGVTIVHRLPYSSINFFAYEQYKAVRYISDWYYSPGNIFCTNNALQRQLLESVPWHSIPMHVI